VKIPVNGLYVLLSILFSLFANTKLAIAQSIQTDGTTPTQAVNCSDSCTIEGGLQQGNNLFHSFERFNVDAGATVLFQDPGVTNILSRVTGNDLSEILGTLGVTGGDANLFLINPNGIIFGENSSLDLNGSFLATTADGIRFGEQGLLDTTANQIPLLTINPSALSFADQNQGVIRNKSTAPTGEVDPTGFPISGLRVPDGKSLIFVGGDVVFDGGIARAFGGRIELGGIEEAGEIKLNFSDLSEGNISLNFPKQIQRGDVSLTNNALAEVLTFQAGGDIAINAKNINILDQSGLVAGTSGNATIVGRKAGKIILNATEKVELTNDSNISNQVAKKATGDAGDIYVTAGSIFISSGSQISAATFGQGDSGNINILSGSANIIGSSPITGYSSGIFSETGRKGENIGEGQAGDIAINTNSFSVAEGGIVNSQTFNENDGGNISINTNTFEAIDGGQVVTSTASSGNAGNIDLQVADNILLSGSDPDFAERLTEFGKNVVGNEVPGNSGLFANVRPKASGVGGDITVTAGSLNIQDGAEINVSAKGTGEAGNLSINAQDITLDQGNLIAETRVGDGGNIIIENTDTLWLRNNSQITANAFEFATGGNINLSSDGIVALNDSDITAQAVQGRGGNINIDTQGILRSPDSEISVESQFGIDGTITINSFNPNPTSEILQKVEIPVDAQTILDQDVCKFEDNKIADGSSFIITGRGGFIATSADSLVNRDRIVNWADRDDLQVSDNGTVGVRQRETQDTKVQSYSETQQAQGLVVAPDGSKWLTANVSSTIPQNSSIKHPDCTKQ
jgi:filamentous hemagglutinin family protein